MKKIMFNDRYGLTEAVLEGRKTMTRRIIPPIVIDWNRRGKVTLPVSSFEGETLFMDASAILDQDFEYPAPAKYQPKFNAEEIVAVAQSYESIFDEMMAGDYGDSIYDAFRWADITESPGWNNKMFVCAGLMPHQIRITNVRIERLQDISEEDCVKEGIWEAQQVNYTSIDGIPYSPREAFATLIDKVSGRGTWKSNPWVYVYEFELVKQNYDK